MKIGIDISPLQSHHRMRGIGYTVLNFINNIPAEERQKHSFVFYQLMTQDNLLNEPLNLLNLKGMDYEVREILPPKRSHKKLPGRLNLLVSVLNQLYELSDRYFGNNRIKDLSAVDVYLQTDQSQSLPRKNGLKTVLFLYDIIPYALEWDYLWSYKTARQRGYSRKGSLRVSSRRQLYLSKVRANAKRAKLLLAISEHTKNDFVKLVGIPANKIKVTPLGVTETIGTTEQVDLNQYVATDWNYTKRPLKLDPKVPFLLFVGGADRRRKLEDLITAFNQLRAKGRNLKLVLAGDSMQGPANVATEEIQYALKTSSYLEDIVFMGFAEDTTRNWLYEHALAFIFPSRSEGFGLPVLEAMIHGCPVISYENEATKEVAGDRPIYVKNSFGIEESVEGLLKLSDAQRDAIANHNKKQASLYNWERTSKDIISSIKS